MAFPKQTPLPFDRRNVESLTAGQDGCYGLFQDKGSWVYVGKGDLRQRLLAHLNGDNSCITRNRPSHFVTVVTANKDALEKTLILELKPICNRRVG